MHWSRLELLECQICIVNSEIPKNLKESPEIGIIWIFFFVVFQDKKKCKKEKQTLVNEKECEQMVKMQKNIKEWWIIVGQ